MPAGNDKERIRAEAAAWVVRLDRGADKQAKSDFAGWIEANPKHRRAYDQAAYHYRLSVLIRQSPVSEEAPLDSEFGKRPALARGVLAAGIAGLLMLGAYQLTSGQLFGPPLQAVLLSSGANARQVQLEDGSSLMLAPSSELQVDLTRRERRAELRRGRARLVIAVERRPFILKAGTREERVSEGQYELTLSQGDGAIEPVAGTAGTASPNGSPPSVGIDEPTKSTPMRPLEFSATPLDEVAALANRMGEAPFLSVDRRVAGLRVTGLFRAGDNAALARSLAATLDLELVATGEGTLRLEPRPK